MLWFARESASYRRLFRPPPSPSKSAAATRVAALQKRWDRLRAGHDLILDQRGADMADLPGGESGMLARDYKGNKPIGWWSASIPVWSRCSPNSAVTSARPSRN
jgi:hypothetical protein